MQSQKALAAQVALQTREFNLKLLAEKKDKLKIFGEQLAQCKEEYSKYLIKHNEIETSLTKEKDKVQKKFATFTNNKNDVDEKKDDDDEKGSNGNEDWSIIDSLTDLEKTLREMKTIICIGKTGLGKSTFINRFTGDASDDGDQGPCKVGDDVKSETSDVSRCLLIKNKVKYCIVDTPGSLDSFGRDKQHTNNIAEYLRGCGGVNAFLIFVTLAEPRIDSTYTELLQLYANMLKDHKWWDHAIIVATKLDLFMHTNRNKLKKMTDLEKAKFKKDRKFGFFFNTVCACFDSLLVVGCWFVI